MSTDPDQIRDDIERTRAELSQNVDALGDKVSPSQIAHRKAESVRSAAGAVKDRVMGTAHDASSSVASAASSAGDSVTGLPGTVRRQAEGSPLAAGLIAFGVGWLVASLLPASQMEQDLARQAKEQASDLIDEVKTVATDLAEDLKEPAQEAAGAVQARAQEAVSTLKEQATGDAQDLRSEAMSAKDSLAEQRQA